MRITQAQGFTLLELLVVVAILVLIAGATITSTDNQIHRAKDAMVISDMSQIKAALEQYKTDNGFFPPATNPADFTGLFEANGQPLFDPSVQQGWHGPYLSKAGAKTVDVTNAVDPGNILSVFAGTIETVKSIADAYQHGPVDLAASPAVGGGSCIETVENDNNCIFDWRFLADDGDSSDDDGDKALFHSGRPYLLLDSGGPDMRLVSFGQNGVFDGAIEASPGVIATSGPKSCIPDSANGADDKILCFFH